MIKRITIRDVASYDHEGVTFNDLAKVNFIFGSNGTGKTTLSRVLAHPMDYPACKVEWDGKPVEVLVYNQDFKHDSLRECVPGVITIGFDQYQNTPRAWFMGKKIERMEKQADSEEKKAEVERLKKEREGFMSRLMSLQPTVDNINRMLRMLGYTGFSIQPSEKNKACYQIQREDGSLVEDSLSEGEATIITFLYFMQMVFDGGNNSESVTGRVVVIDDPVSSLDADAMFVVSEMVCRILDCVRGRKTPRWRMPAWSFTVKDDGLGMRLVLPVNGFLQVFVLTHNVYFYKQITERQQYADTHYWKLGKHEGKSRAIAYGEENPIRSEYELLWGEVRKAQNNETVVGLANVMRRIIETYFVVAGGYNKRNLIPEHFSDDPEEMAIVSSLAKWGDEGSHAVAEDLYGTISQDMCCKYIKVFRQLFERLGHEAHYKMMMREGIG